MLGHPKYEENDIVRFTSTSADGKEQEREGSIAIIDAYGTFEQNKEVSYDIYNNKENILYKHVIEPLVTFVRKGAEEESLKYFYNVRRSHEDLLMSVSYLREFGTGDELKKPFLYLRPLRESDKDDLQRMMDDQEVYKYVPTFVPERKYKTAEEFIRNVYYDELNVSCTFAIIEVLNANFEYFCGLVELYYFKEIKDEVYIGIRIPKVSWHDHVAKRVISTLCPYLLLQTNIKTIKATTMVDNDAVNGLLENAKFNKVEEAEEDWGFESKVPVYKWTLSLFDEGMNETD